MELKRRQNILLGVYYAYLLVDNIDNVFEFSIVLCELYWISLGLREEAFTSFCIMIFQIINQKPT
jgi:hypothetical protein